MENTIANQYINGLIDSCSQIRIMLFEKQPGRGKNYKVYLFPNDPTKEVIDDYKRNFNLYTQNREAVDYSQTEIKKDTIQKLPCSEFPQWEEYQNLIDNIPITNAPLFTFDKLTKNLTMVVVECILDSGPVYLISKFSYKNVYGRKIRFTYVGDTFKKLGKPVLTLGDCIDCFIYNNDVYILLESRFDALFDFHKKIKDEVSANISTINDWDFFDNNDIASDIINKPRKGRQFIKVINSENLNTWKSKTLADRKAIILGDDKLKDKFKFDEQDRIVYSKEALNELFKLLTDDYFKSIITGQTGER